MIAAVLLEANKPMPIMELQQSKPKTGEVLVKMSKVIDKFLKS